jgi:FtsP/CotA-like multicopper oxidase with cupredoxin domain
MRSLIKLTLLLAGLVALVVVGFGGFIAWSFVTAKVDTVGEVAFDRPLAIPALAESHVEGDTRVFDLTLQRGRTDFGRDEKTPTWGVNGSYLGPTLRADRGEKVRVQVSNELSEASTLHWHGMHLSAEMDGGPHQMSEPGAIWSPSWQVRQPAATLWYHPHPHEQTAKHVYRGVAGMFIVDDPASDERLPSSYGVDDVPVIVQDKRFDGSGLDETGSLFSSAGLLGDTVLVNGTPGPYLDVTSERVRLRLLNASNARIYNFVLSDGRAYDVIASDGGLPPAPVSRTHLTLSPGERAEIVVAMKPRERIVLRSAPLVESSNRFGGTDDSLDVLQLRAATTLRPSPELPAVLGKVPQLQADDVVKTRDFDLAGTGINGRDMDMGRIDRTVTVDTTERWRVRNTDGSPHNFHIHDVQFQLALLDGEAPPPELAGWKDTILLPPGREAEVLVRFADYTDADTPYMYHCHLLRHEDQGMMGQFVVVKAGESAHAPTDHQH